MRASQVPCRNMRGVRLLQASMTRVSLVGSVTGISSGVNLHHACHIIVCFSMTTNIAMFLQEIGRVHRMVQPFERGIYVLTTNHSYDQVIIDKAINKIIMQHCGEASFQPIGRKIVSTRSRLENSDIFHCRQYPRREDKHACS